MLETYPYYEVFSPNMYREILEMTEEITKRLQLQIESMVYMLQCNMNHNAGNCEVCHGFSRSPSGVETAHDN
jgi:hypothetical protein